MLNPLLPKTHNILITFDNQIIHNIRYYDTYDVYCTPKTSHLAPCDEHWELTEEEILLNVLLNVSGLPSILGALHNRSRPPPDGPSLAWWKVPCSRVVRVSFCFYGQYRSG